MGKKKKKAKIPRSLQKKRRERERAKSAIQRSQDNLIAKAKSKSANVVVSPSNATKMSEVIMEFAEPYLERATTMEDQKKALTMAIAMWNLSMLPKEKRAEEIEKLLGKLGGPEADPREDAESKKLIQFFMDRKEKLFPDIERLILNYDMVETPQGVHLNVVSTVSEKRAALTGSEKDKGNTDAG